LSTSYCAPPITYPLKRTMHVKETELGPFFHPDGYPRLWDWLQLKEVVDSGDLGNLKRHPSFQHEYDESCRLLARKHGSVVNYLVNTRLQWDLSKPITFNDFPGSRKYFTADIAEDLVRIVINDWPYSVPEGVVHYLVWSRLPFVHPDLIPVQIHDRVAHDGLWGFTGGDTEPKNIGADTEVVKSAAREICTFVTDNWTPQEWETAWFMNPPRLQSVPGLAHIHVFARKKGLDVAIDGVAADLH